MTTRFLAGTFTFLEQPQLKDVRDVKLALIGAKVSEFALAASVTF